MQTATTPIESVKELKQDENFRVGSLIRKSITDETVIGVNVYTNSTIRKQSFTLAYVQGLCNSRGWTMTDRYPCNTSMEIYFN